MRKHACLKNPSTVLMMKYKSSYYLRRGGNFQFLHIKHGSQYQLAEIVCAFGGQYNAICAIMKDWLRARICNSSFLLC